MGVDFRQAPFRSVHFGCADTAVVRRPDGSLILHSPEPLGEYARCVTAPLSHWAAARPDQPYLAERAPDGGWRRVTYAQAYDTVRRLGQALIERGLSAERPLVVLSGNDIEHGLLMLAAMHVGVPIAPISVPYSLVSKDFEKLRYIFDLLKPGLVFAASGRVFERAIAAVVPASTEVVVRVDPPAGRAATLWETLAATAPTPEVEAAHDAIRPDTVAKFLFTSGSTGVP